MVPSELFRHPTVRLLLVITRRLSAASYLHALIGTPESKPREIFTCEMSRLMSLIQLICRRSAMKANSSSSNVLIKLKREKWIYLKRKTATVYDTIGKEQMIACGNYFFTIGRAVCIAGIRYSSWMAL